MFHSDFALARLAKAQQREIFQAVEGERLLRLLRPDRAGRRRRVRAGGAIRTAFLKRPNARQSSP